ncbi:MAG: ATP-dependent zinc protease [Vibrio sp.]
MDKKSLAIAVFTITSLSGCAYMNGEHYSQQTIDAVKQSEQTISSKMAELDANLAKQNEYIASLEKEVISLNDQVEVLQQQQRNEAVLRKQQVATATAAIQSTVSMTNAEPQVRSGMVTLGSLENVNLDAAESSFVARVDTGATTSSINAVDMQEFERNGKKWVKFHISDETAPEDRVWIEAPIVRHVKIRQSTNEELERRPVVDLWIKIGQLHEKAQFTLADRSQMDYPILLGREFIQDVAFVDVSREFVESKAPKKQKKSEK